MLGFRVQVSGLGCRLSKNRAALFGGFIEDIQGSIQDCTELFCLESRFC